MADLTELANVAIQAMATALTPQAIVWFGSAAVGRARADSDLDFLIISPRSAGSRKDILRRARRAIWTLPAPVDLLVYFPDEIEDRRDMLGGVVGEALRTGVVVHGQV